jgi:predicted O-linked N-acetylglucosamine transferase (SPINDLY family)
MSTKTRADFGLPEDRNIYLCPQVLFKFHPDFDQVIAAILRADPRGEVVLVDSPLKYWTHLLMSRFAHSMPDVMHRIRTLPRQSTDDFLRLLTLGDVILDTLHFSGGTTSFMALAMGSPVVTLPGDYMRGRVTYACYKQMGLLDCVTHSIDDYVTLAVRLGTDPSYREHIKARILRSNHVLYEDIEPVRELERFFTGALEKL